MSALSFAAPDGFALVRVIDAHAFGATLLVERRGTVDPLAGADGRAGGARFVVKRLSARTRGEAEARAQLAREHAVLVALDGRGAPCAVALGEDAGGPFVVVEYVDAPPLAKLLGLRREGASHDGASRDAAWLGRAARAAFAALAAVHDAGDARGPLGVIHGDVSPANVLVAEDGRGATFVDFALARMRDAVPSPTSAVRGTLLYAAPEIARGEPFDARADRFALAASLLHVASGTPPRASSGAALLVEAGEGDLTAWATSAARVFPADVGAALVRSVAFDAASRDRAEERFA